MHIRDYLIQEAAKITARSLPVFSSLRDLEIWRKERQKIFHKILGIDQYLEKDRTPLNIKRMGVLKRAEYRIEKLYFESLPGLYVTANLYVPNHAGEPLPGIIYVCGHNAKQKIAYQHHARKFALLGFVTLILDTIQFSEAKGIHWGMFRYGMFNWISLGYSPAGPEVWNAIRGVDVLSEMDEVDENRIGMTGTSGGGAITWWTGCADDRIKVMASSCGTGTLESQLRDSTIDGHCDCMFPPNPYKWSLIEFYSLLAPRPMLIATPDQDAFFKLDSVYLVYKRLKVFYKNIGLQDKLNIVEVKGPHSYQPQSRKAIFSWFIKHLSGGCCNQHQELDIDAVIE